MYSPVAEYWIKALNGLKAWLGRPVAVEDSCGECHDIADGCDEERASVDHDSDDSEEKQDAQKD